MRSTVRYPSLFQINTRVRLSELAREMGRPATLDDVTDGELERLTGAVRTVVGAAAAGRTTTASGTA